MIKISKKNSAVEKVLKLKTINLKFMGMNKFNFEQLNQELERKTAKIKLFQRQIEDLKEYIVNIEQGEKNLNSKLLERFHQAQEELLFYRAKDNYEKYNPLINNSKFYYGAKYRVENDLPYRLGAIVVKYSKSPKGIVKLPKLLRAEYKKFHKEDKGSNLPPIESYRDYVEAERVTEHLSYKIGLIIVENFKEPYKLLSLPFALTKEIYYFNQKNKT